MPQIAQGSEEFKGGCAIITRKSSFTGKIHSMELPITESQYRSWQNGALIQDAMPHLTASQREFLMTGATQEEWDAVFGKDDEE